MMGVDAKGLYRAPTDLVDLRRYPIEDLGSQSAQTLVADCQTRLRDSGAFALPGFVKPEAAAALAAEVQPLIASAFRQKQQHNVYFKRDDPAFPEDHPSRRRLRTSQAAIAYDLISPKTGIHRIYNWPPLRAFIAAVLGQDALYLHADPLAALNVMVLEDGDELGWHYDRADYVTTILLQRPEAGGNFEFVPYLRRPDDENYQGLGQLLEGTHPGIVSRPGQAGTLTLFSGHYSIHRVSPAHGPTPRIVAVLSYENEPGVVFSASARTRFYGRAG